MAAERRQIMTINATNGIHLYVRPTTGGTTAGHIWIPVPDGGVADDSAHPNLLTAVSQYLGTMDDRPPSLTVDAPTWESVRAEIDRIYREDLAKKATAAVKEAEELSKWREQAKVYLGGGIRGLALGRNSRQTDEERKQIKTEDQRRRDALVAERSAEIESIIGRLSAGEGKLDTPPRVCWYELDNRHMSWGTDDIKPELQNHLNDIAHKRKCDVDRKESETKARVTAEREQWIRDHGSLRLKKALSVGMSEKIRGAYRDERIMFELGEKWISWHAAVEDLDDDRINPPEWELDALLAERERWRNDRLEIQLRAVQCKVDANFRPALMMHLPWKLDQWAIRYLD